MAAIIGDGATEALVEAYNIYGTSTQHLYQHLRAVARSGGGAAEAQASLSRIEQSAHAVASGKRGGGGGAAMASAPLTHISAGGGGASAEQRERLEAALRSDCLGVVSGTEVPPAKYLSPSREPPKAHPDLPGRFRRYLPVPGSRWADDPEGGAPRGILASLLLRYQRFRSRRATALVGPDGRPAGPDGARPADSQRPSRGKLFFNFSADNTAGTFFIFMCLLRLATSIYFYVYHCYGNSGGADSHAFPAALQQTLPHAQPQYVGLAASRACAALKTGQFPASAAAAALRLEYPAPLARASEFPSFPQLFGSNTFVVSAARGASEPAYAPAGDRSSGYYYYSYFDSTVTGNGAEGGLGLLSVILFALARVAEAWFVIPVAPRCTHSFGDPFGAFTAESPLFVFAREALWLFVSAALFLATPYTLALITYSDSGLMRPADIAGMVGLTVERNPRRPRRATVVRPARGKGGGSSMVSLKTLPYAVVDACACNSVDLRRLHVLSGNLQRFSRDSAAGPHDFANVAAKPAASFASTAAAPPPSSSSAPSPRRRSVHLSGVAALVKSPFLILLLLLYPLGQVPFAARLKFWNSRRFRAYLALELLAARLPPWLRGDWAPALAAGATGPDGGGGGGGAARPQWKPVPSFPPDKGPLTPLSAQYCRTCQVHMHQLDHHCPVVGACITGGFGEPLRDDRDGANSNNNSGGGGGGSAAATYNYNHGRGGGNLGLFLAMLCVTFLGCLWSAVALEVPYLVAAPLLSDGEPPPALSHPFRCDGDRVVRAAADDRGGAAGGAQMVGVGAAAVPVRVAVGPLARTAASDFVDYARADSDLRRPWAPPPSWFSVHGGGAPWPPSPLLLRYAVGADPAPFADAASVLYRAEPGQPQLTVIGAPRRILPLAHRVVLWAGEIAANANTVMPILMIIIQGALLSLVGKLLLTYSVLFYHNRQSVALRREEEVIAAARSLDCAGQFGGLIANTSSFSPDFNMFGSTLLTGPTTAAHACEEPAPAAEESLEADAAICPDCGLPYIPVPVPLLNDESIKRAAGGDRDADTEPSAAPAPTAVVEVVSDRALELPSVEARVRFFYLQERLRLQQDYRSSGLATRQGGLRWGRLSRRDRRGLTSFDYMPRETTAEEARDSNTRELTRKIQAFMPIGIYIKWLACCGVCFFPARLALRNAARALGELLRGRSPLLARLRRYLCCDALGCRGSLFVDKFLQEVRGALVLCWAFASGTRCGGMCAPQPTAAGSDSEEAEADAESYTFLPRHNADAAAAEEDAADVPMSIDDNAYNFLVAWVLHARAAWIRSTLPIVDGRGLPVDQ